MRDNQNFEFFYQPCVLRPKILQSLGEIPCSEESIDSILKQLESDTIKTAKERPIGRIPIVAFFPTFALIGAIYQEYKKEKSLVSDTTSIFRNLGIKNVVFEDDDGNQSPLQSSLEFILKVIVSINSLDLDYDPDEYKTIIREWSEDAGEPLIDPWLGDGNNEKTVMELNKAACLVGKNYIEELFADVKNAWVERDKGFGQHVNFRKSNEEEK